MYMLTPLNRISKNVMWTQLGQMLVYIPENCSFRKIVINLYFESGVANHS